MSYSRIFFYILLGFLSGIVLHSFFISLPPLFWSITVALCFGIIIFCWRRPYFWAGICLVTAAVLGVCRFDAAITKLNVAFFSGEVTMRAVSEISQYPKSYQFVAQTSAGRFWVIAPLTVAIHYGDTLQGRCQFERVATTDTYFGWYASKGTRSVCFLKQPQITTRTSSVIARLFDVKYTGLKMINYLFANERGALLGGMLFGGTSGLSKETANNFKTAGLTHLVAISGYNFSLLIFFVMSVFSFLYIPRKIASVAAIGLTIVFFILVGPSASAARAVIMSGMILVAKMIGRQRNMTRIFTVVAATLLLINPLSLRFDAGFVLSFVATGTLIYAVPRLLSVLEGWMRLETLSVQILWWPVKSIVQGFFEIIAASSLIMITTAPVLWFFFGRVSPASVLSNALVGPIVPLVMMGGYTLAIMSFVSLPMASVLVWPLDLLLHYIIGVTNFLS